MILSDGEEVYADYVIGTADGYTTIYKMLDGKFVNKKIDFANGFKIAFYIHASQLWLQRLILIENTVIMVPLL